MSGMDFFLLVGAGALVLIIYYWIVSGLVDTCAFACKLLNRIITWPFRALGRLVSPQKKKKTQHFHFEDDDIDIRF